MRASALSARQLFARGAAVGHEEAGARIAAVGHRECPAHGGLRARLLPCPAVVAIAGHRLTDHDDQAGIRVNDDLVVGGVPIVLWLFSDAVDRR